MFEAITLRLSFDLINTLPLIEGHNRLDYLRFSTLDSPRAKAYLAANDICYPFFKPRSFSYYPETRLVG